VLEALFAAYFNFSLYVQEKDVVAQVDPDLYYNKGIVSKIEIGFH
jgi:hypothetical protein